MPEYRRKHLKQLIDLCPIVKTIEVHSGLTGLIAEKTIVERDGCLDQFDAMWVSSLCDSTAKENCRTFLSAPSVGCASGIFRKRPKTRGLQKIIQNLQKTAKICYFVAPCTV